MQTYKLTAKLGNKKSTRTLWATDGDYATLEAIGVIMDLAYKDKDGPWARGAITLTAPNGEVIREMAEK